MGEQRRVKCDICVGSNVCTECDGTGECSFCEEDGIKLIDESDHYDYEEIEE